MLDLHSAVESIRTNGDKPVIYHNGQIATLHCARKTHKCAECGLLIEPGDGFYSVVYGGSGLGGLKFPDAVMTGCLDNYFGKKR